MMWDKEAWREKDECTKPRVWQQQGRESRLCEEGTESVDQLHLYSVNTRGTSLGFNGKQDTGRVILEISFVDPRAALVSFAFCFSSFHSYL